MKNTNTITPLGNLPAAIQHATHRLQVTLRGSDGHSTSCTTLDLDTRPESPPRLLILELPARAQKRTGKMQQLSEEQSEFTVELACAPNRAKLHDLSGTPLSDWMSATVETFLRCQAVVAVLLKGGRIFVALHKGDR